MRKKVIKPNKQLIEIQETLKEIKTLLKEHARRSKYKD